MTFLYKILFFFSLFLFFVLLFLGFRVENKKKKAIALFSGQQNPQTHCFSWLKLRIKGLLTIFSLVFILIALARPRMGFQNKTIDSGGFDILFAVDCSRSMLAQDIKPNRLERTKLAIRDFVEKQTGANRVGLIAFSGDAFLQCPLTLDYEAFYSTLNTLDTEIIPIGGTNLASAIEAAEKTFTSQTAKILILLSDGEDLEGKGLQRAQQAAEGNTKIFTIGIGSTHGEIIPFTDEKGQTDYVKDEKGQIVKTVLDEEGLKKIAQCTHAAYVPLGANGEGLDHIYNHYLSRTTKEKHGSFLQRIPIERFSWFLGLALLCLVLESLIGTYKSHKSQ